MNSFKYRIYHDEDNPLCGSLSNDPERHEELKGYEYGSMHESLRLYYLGKFGTPPYSGGEVKVTCEDAPSNGGVIVTLNTGISKDEAHGSLLEFTEHLKKIQGRNPSLCLDVKECYEK
jgi:hypothetical protein